MGNKLTSEKQNNKIYKDTFTSINDDKIKYIKQNYIIINVDWIDRDLVHENIVKNEYFIANPAKIEIVNDMLNYYLTRNDKYIYQKKTDLLCNKKQNICLCNTYAEDYRKILDGINYKKDQKYISWIRILNEPF
jgi:hypothetical protein